MNKVSQSTAIISKYKVKILMVWALAVVSTKIMTVVLDMPTLIMGRCAYRYPLNIYYWGDSGYLPLQGQFWYMIYNIVYNPLWHIITTVFTVFIIIMLLIDYLWVRGL